MKKNISCKQSKKPGVTMLTSDKVDFNTKKMPETDYLVIVELQRGHNSKRVLL